MTANHATSSSISSGDKDHTKMCGIVSLQNWLRWVRVGSVVAICISLFMLVRLLPVDRLVALLSLKVGQLGVWGSAAFALVYILAAVFFVPGSALTLAAGAVFGLGVGSIVVSLVSTTAAAISFLIGRYLARDAVQNWAATNPCFAAIDRAIGQGGWKIIALLRLSPAVPFSLGNYLFGITSIRFWPYVLTSWIFMMPGTFMFVYLGYAGRAGIAAATAGGGSERSPAQWVLLVVGLIATVAVTIYVTRLARNAIKNNNVMLATLDESAVPAKPIEAHRPGTLTTMITALLALAMVSSTACAYTNRSKITGLFGPPVVTLGETYSEKIDGPKFDHSALDALLRRCVDDAGLVDYVALRKESTVLDGYIATLANAPLNDMGRGERLALLINTYNAFTLRLILDHYPVKSIKDIPADQRWDAKRWNLGGNLLSLNQIEHEQIRPHFKEPRIHFALVCAAMGCPPLRNEAYVATRLEQQLDAQARYVHSHARWFVFDAEKNVVKLTSLYNWYGSDFEQVAGSIAQFAARYSLHLKNAMDSGNKPTTEFLDYDWSLNAKEKP